MKKTYKLFLGSIIPSLTLPLVLVSSTNSNIPPQRNINEYQTSSLDITDTNLEFNDWMKYVDGQKRLGDLSIPGTHDSAMFSGWGAKWFFGQAWAKTQSRNFQNQLKSGIRFFDLRISTDMWIYHGNVGSNYDLKKVLKEFVTFLKAHPNEVILIRYKDENSDPKKMSSRDALEWKKEIVKTFENPEIRDYIYKNSSQDSFENPTLDSVRGKIFVLDNMHKNIWKNNFSYGAAWWSVLIDVQDEWNTTEQVKMQKIKETLNLSNNENNGNHLIINFTSRSKDNSKPYETHKEINKQTMAYLKANNILRTGVLIFDFPGDALLKRIVQTNYTYTQEELNRPNLLPRVNLNFFSPTAGENFIQANASLANLDLSVEILDTKKEVRTPVNVRIDINSNRIYLPNNLQVTDRIMITYNQKTIPNIYYPQPQKYNQTVKWVSVEKNSLFDRLLANLENKVREGRRSLIEITGLGSSETKLFTNYFARPLIQLKQNPTVTQESINQLRDLNLALKNNFDTWLNLLKKKKEVETKIQLLNQSLVSNYLNQNDFESFFQEINNQEAEYQRILSLNSLPTIAQWNSYFNFYQSADLKISFLNDIIAQNQAFNRDSFLNKLHLPNNLNWANQFYLNLIDSKLTLMKTNLVNSISNFSNDSKLSAKRTIENLNSQFVNFGNFVDSSSNQLSNALDSATNLSSVQKNFFHTDFEAALTSNRNSDVTSLIAKINQFNSFLANVETQIANYNQVLSSNYYNFASNIQKTNFTNWTNQLKANKSTWNYAELNNLIIKINNLVQEMQRNFESYEARKKQLQNEVNGLTYISDLEKQNFQNELESNRDLEQMEIKKEALITKNKENESLINFALSKLGQ
ncbi:1-phosphatidylinositol phosphodiesterase precursor (plasmid) [Mycoplasmopsis gallopavonis]|uniref:1-phosphatidylinositol phosphodiesterase n=2 Tax=Mycoplasmopsis gallopavonis TaxID=76629 RepID=A0A449B0U1_9BACT|nr:phosphatidylinositol-specific phospholipase C domain-containing protein [Mycoplasmopsis gallopavonis]VEU73338.1 1-phosphatidylinositol phosphodiesterase precursor [Mycoplasmopsis gallopavonis]